MTRTHMESSHGRLGEFEDTGCSWLAVQDVDFWKTLSEFIDIEEVGLCVKMLEVLCGCLLVMVSWGTSSVSLETHQRPTKPPPGHHHK